MGDWAQERERVTRDLRDHLHKAQHRMKQFADKRRVDREFKVGDWVYLKLQPYRQLTIAVRKNLKLSSRYYGPFEVEERIGAVAYRLRLPEGSRIHPVFHISLLKKSPPEQRLATPTVPLVGEEGQLLAEPEKILDRRLTPRGNRAVTQVLVKWSNMPEEAATWEDYWFLKSQFPSFDT